MKIVKVNDANYQEVIGEAVAMLTSGGLVIYPTETCYGAGVDATNQNAVDKLLRYKERPEGKAIAIAVCDEQMAEAYVALNETAKNLYRNFLPGPLTVISQSKGKVAKGLEAENGTLGVRVPKYQTALALINQFGKAITATSANASGRKTPYKIADILDHISNKKKELIDLVIDAGELPHNPPSTVVDTTLNDVSLIRKGAIDLVQLKGKKYISQSAEHTKRIARQIVEQHLENLKSHCLIIALQGELGAGKTQFAKGAAKALGIKENVKSPTFTLMNEYPFKIFPAKRDPASQDNFYHIDTWRMREGKELLELGFEEMIQPGNVIVIEWLEKVREILDNVAKYQHVMMVWVEMKYISERTRDIMILLNYSKRLI